MCWSEWHKSARPQSRKNPDRHTVRQEETEKTSRTSSPASSPTRFFPHTNHKRVVFQQLSHKRGLLILAFSTKECFVNKRFFTKDPFCHTGARIPILLASQIDKCRNHQIRPLCNTVVSGFANALFFELQNKLIRIDILRRFKNCTRFSCTYLHIYKII